MPDAHDRVERQISLNRLTIEANGKANRFFFKVYIAAIQPAANKSTHYFATNAKTAFGWLASMSQHGYSAQTLTHTLTHTQMTDPVYVALHNGVSERFCKIFRP